MGLGILEDNHLKHVPGTSLFSKDPNAIAAALYDGIDLSTLKHGKGRHAYIILVPQPSDDPNDPLNWSTAKKWMTFFVLTYGTVLCGALGPLVSGAQVELAVIFGVSISAISRALGTALVTTLGLSTVIWAAFSTKFGKRPVYILATVFMAVGCIVAGESKTYGTLLGSRIIQGIGQAPLEFLVGSSIADLFHVHERGVPIAIWTIALLNGINVTPPISGQVFAHLGWRWCWRIFWIACIPLLVLQVFCMPETTYHRAPITPHQAGHDSPTEKHIDDQLEAASVVPAKKPYRHSLKVYNGVFDKEHSFMSLVAEPFRMLISPVVLFSIVTYGLCITFLVVIATGAAQVFAGQYGFGPVGTGNVYIAALIADFLAAALMGPLIDYSAAFFSRLNGGTFEPEFRLPIGMLFYLVFGAMGLIGFGISAQQKLTHWAPIIFFGILNFGFTVGCASIVAYVVETHRRSGDAALGAVIFGKNVLSAIFTAFTNDWLAAGIQNAFVVMGALIVGTSLLTIPMWIYGKRTRSLISRRLKIEKEEATVVAS
ncbi:hypothetical protein JCM3770_006964 [Rhodotorula araucariae]